MKLDRGLKISPIGHWMKGRGETLSLAGNSFEYFRKSHSISAKKESYHSNIVVPNVYVLTSWMVKRILQQIAVMINYSHLLLLVMKNNLITQVQHDKAQLANLKTKPV